MSDIAISVVDLCKNYPLYPKVIDRLLELLDPRRKKRHSLFRALNNLNFNIKKGETVGIIGTNGSGKSTLLKILTGVVTQSSGELSVHGNISALLELGAGFNPDYTGRENIFLNGAIMGYTEQEMQKKVPEIIEFANIGDFIDQPVRLYSSGMFARLAFSLAISVEPDVLVVDEALSVGDVFFQSKCFRKFKDLQKSGTTILLVSHDLASIVQYCDEVILLNKGVLVKKGSPKEVVDLYKKILVNQFDDEVSQEKDLEANPTPETSCWKSTLHINDNFSRYGDQNAEFLDYAVLDENGLVTNVLEKGRPFSIKLKVLFHHGTKHPIYAFTLRNNKGQELCGTNTMTEKIDTGYCDKGEIYIVQFTQEMNLNSGTYLLSLGCTNYNNLGELVVYDRLYDLCSLTVLSDKNSIGVFDMNSAISIGQQKDA